MQSNNQVVFTKPKLLLLFDHRSLVDITDGDYLEMEAWEEALSSFGVENLTRKIFFENMSQRSESDVMKSMCPFTTRMEWDSFLNKKRQKMNHELKEWCFANCVPIPGVVEFMDACSREFSENNNNKKNESSVGATSSTTTTTTIESPDCLSIWLTPWKLEQAHGLLSACSLKSHVSPAIVDSSEFTFLDVLEMFGLRAPLETPLTLQQLARNRGEIFHLLQDKTNKNNNNGDDDEASDLINIATTQQFERFVANREKTLEKVQSCTLNGNNNNNNNSETKTKVIVFTNSSRLARQATTSGLTAVGISYNSYDQEEDEKVLLDGCDNEAALLAAGCRVVLKDYSRFHPRYLRML